MAINVFLKDDINRLVKPTSRKVELPSVANAPAIGSKRGSAGPTSSWYGSGSDSDSDPFKEITEETHNEVISVYSTIILTEDGAYEKPVGWPDTGDYPEGGALDTGAAYYEQKREHLALFEIVYKNRSGKEIKSLVTQNYLVRLAYPYEGDSMIGLANYSSWTPELYIDVFNTGNAEISAMLNKIQELM